MELVEHGRRNDFRICDVTEVVIVFVQVRITGDVRLIGRVEPEESVVLMAAGITPGCVSANCTVALPFSGRSCIGAPLTTELTVEETVLTSVSVLWTVTDSCTDPSSSWKFCSSRPPTSTTRFWTPPA
jgi:hypothetical protein